MKKLIHSLIIIAVVFTALIIGFNSGFSSAVKNQLRSRNVAVNRINREISDAAENGASPDETIAERKAEWKKTYGSNTPESIVYIPLKNNGIVFYTAVDRRCCQTVGRRDSRGQPKRPSPYSTDPERAKGISRNFGKVWQVS